MARPLRIEFPGAFYHVSSRSSGRASVYRDDADREAFLEVLGQVVRDWNWVCHAFCLMPNHYQLLIETPDGNLSKGMRHLNGVYTQASNRRHCRSGPLFQGRYKAILIDADAYLLELSRYVVLTPVRAGFVKEPGEWRWSSFRAAIGDVPPQPWLALEGLHSRVAAKQGKARRRYRKFVMAGIDQPSVWKALRRQVFLGDDRFVSSLLERRDRTGDGNPNGRKGRRHPPLASLEELAGRYRDRNQAIVAAHRTGEYSYQRIGAFFGLHFTTVGKIVRAAKYS